ncbi:sodium:solute symporter family transporter [Cerasicoccus arenae]|uniref:Transporter n=1 Tax=Cerasicoccus arenae TaxID=424488 RepID=A0A8J3DGB2_9BACT|nr:hypothetical protein [Cerasicoccus arenae]MBK1858117.1 hypothetical protein [Cerasicoccus arenae]GHB96583.1 transporter [Cerasicoccus arenae]
MQNLHPVEYVVIGAYLVLMLAVGLLFKRLNRNANDYFRGGCKATWWLVGMSAFMASFSAWTFTGAAGVAYESGFSCLIIYLGNAAGFLLNFLFFAPWFRQLRLTTGPEVIRDRFGPGTQQLYAAFGILLGVLYAALHLYGLAIFSSAVFGLKVETVIVVIGIVVLVYSTSGGNWAVMATDFLQSLILIPMTLAVTGLCLYHLGGFEGFQAAVAKAGLANDYKMFNNIERFAGAYTWGWATAFFLKNTLEANSLGSAPRYFAVKDGASAKKAALLAMILTLLGMFAWFIPPMTARLLFDGHVQSIDIAKPAEAAYAVASLELLPIGLVGLVVVAMFAATMSSMDTGLNRNAAILVKDIIPAVLRLFRVKAEANEEKWLRVGQVLTLFLGLIITFVAYLFSQSETHGIFDTMLVIGSYLGVPMSVPMILGLWIRRAPSWAAIASVTTGLGGSLTVAALQKAGHEFIFQETLTITALASASGFLLSCLGWKLSSDRYRAKVTEFFERMHTPVDFAAEVGEGNDHTQLRLLGWLITVVGALILPLILFSTTSSDRIAVCWVSIFLIGFGAFMLYRAKSSNV